MCINCLIISKLFPEYVSFLLLLAFGYFSDDTRAEGYTIEYMSS